MTSIENEHPMDVLIKNIKPLQANWFPDKLSFAELLTNPKHKGVLIQHLLDDCLLDAQEVPLVLDSLRFLAQPTIKVDSGFKAEQTIGVITIGTVRKMAMSDKDSLGKYVGLQGEGNISKEIIVKLFSKKE